MQATAGTGPGGRRAFDGEVRFILQAAMALFVYTVVIDHVDALEAGGRAQVDAVVVDDEVASLDQLDAHLAREEGVLEVRRVVGARREDDRAHLVGRDAIGPHGDRSSPRS